MNGGGHASPKVPMSLLLLTKTDDEPGGLGHVCWRVPHPHIKG
jgi:hypothetical protein